MGIMGTMTIYSMLSNRRAIHTMTRTSLRWVVGLCILSFKSSITTLLSLFKIGIIAMILVYSCYQLQRKRLILAVYVEIFLFGDTLRDYISMVYCNVIYKTFGHQLWSIILLCYVDYLCVSLPMMVIDCFYSHSRNQGNLTQKSTTWNIYETPLCGYHSMRQYRL